MAWGGGYRPYTSESDYKKCEIKKIYKFNGYFFRAPAYLQLLTAPWNNDDLV